MRTLSCLVFVSITVLAGCIADDEAVLEEPIDIDAPAAAPDQLCDAELDGDINAEFRPDRPAKLLDPGGVPDIGEPDPRDPAADCQVTGACTMRTAPPVDDDDDLAPRGCLRVATS